MIAEMIDKAILLNLSLRHCDSTYLFRDLEVFGFTSRYMTILILTPLP